MADYTIRKDVLGDVSRKTSFDAVRDKLDEIKPAPNCKVLEVGGSNGIIRSMFPETVDYVVAAPWTEFIPENSGCDIHSLPYGDSEFDFVIVDNVLEHVKDLQRAVGEVYRVLKSGGWSLTLTPFITNFHAGRACGDYWRISPLGYKALFRNFSHVEAYGWGNRGIINILQRAKSYWNISINECLKNELNLLSLDTVKPVEADEIVNYIKTTGGLYDEFFIFTWCFARR